MDMKQWKASLMTPQGRRALPVLSFPAASLMGVTAGQLATDEALQAESIRLVAQRCPVAAAMACMDVSVEAECFGAQLRFSEDKVPIVARPLIDDLEEAEELELPAVGSGRTGLRIAAAAKAARELEQTPVFGGCIGPFSLAGSLIELSEVMACAMEEPELLHPVMEKLTDFLISYLTAMKEAGIQGVMMAEPSAGLLSPELCREFSSDYIRKIVDAVQDDSFLILYHNCGPAAPRMIPEMVATGCAGYHFGNVVDLKEMLEKMPADALVMGNLDPLGVLRGGTPESVEEATRQLLERCGEFPNFVPSSGCDLPADVPWENLDAFFRVVEAWAGR